MRTMKQLACVVNLHNGANLSGIVHTFSSVITDLRQLLIEECAKECKPFSMDMLNEHPICVLLAAKIADLSLPEWWDEGRGFQDACEWSEKVRSE